MIRTYAAAILLALSGQGTAAAEWHKADGETNRHVANCVMDQVLQTSTGRQGKDRYDVVFSLKSIDEFRVPGTGRQWKPKLVGQKPFRCVHRQQRDLYPLLMKEGKLVVTNGRPVADNGYVDGYAAGMMEVFENGRILAIYVQSGAYARKGTRSGGDCVYDATSSGRRLYFEKWSNTFVLVGEEELWVADAALAPCWDEK